MATIQNVNDGDGGLVARTKINSNANNLNTIPSGQILVGNSFNISTAVAMSGDINIDNTGNTTIQPGVVNGSKISSSVSLSGTPTVSTPDGTNAQAIANVQYVLQQLQNEQSTIGWTTIGATLGQYATVRLAYAAGKTNLWIIENTSEVGTVPISLTSINPNLSIVLNPSIVWDCSSFSGTVIATTNTINSFFYIRTGANAKIIYTPTTSYSGFFGVFTSGGTPSPGSTFYSENLNFDISNLGGTVLGISPHRNIGSIVSTGITNIYLPNNPSSGIRYINANTLINENATINFIGNGSTTSSVIEYNSSTAVCNINGLVNLFGTYSSTNPAINITANFNSGINIETSTNPINLSLGGNVLNIKSNGTLINITVLNPNIKINNVDLEDGQLNINNQTGFVGYSISNFTAINTQPDTFINGMALINSPTAGNILVDTITGQAMDSGTALSAVALLNSPNFTGIPTAPTAPPGTNTTQIATTAFVQNAISSKQSNLGITTVGTSGADFTSVRTAIANGRNLIRIITNVTETAQIQFANNVCIIVGSNLIWTLPNVQQPIRAVTSSGVTFMIETEVNAVIQYYPTILNSVLFSGAVPFNLYRQNCTIDISGATQPVLLFNSAVNNVYSTGITTINLPNLNNSGFYYDIQGNSYEGCDLILKGGGTNCSNVIAFLAYGNYFKSITLTGTFSNSGIIIDSTGAVANTGNCNVPAINIFIENTSTLNFNIGGNIGSIYNPFSSLVTCNVNVISPNCILNNANLGGGTLNVNNKTGFKAYGVYNYTVINSLSDSLINALYPGGSSGQLQYNNGSNGFAGADIITDGSNLNLPTGGITTVNAVNFDDGAFYSDGSGNVNVSSLVSGNSINGFSIFGATNTLDDGSGNTTINGLFTANSGGEYLGLHIFHNNVGVEGNLATADGQINSGQNLANLFVSKNANSNDSNAGTLISPFATIQNAVNISATSSATNNVVTLDAGIYAEAPNLSLNNGLTIKSIANAVNGFNGGFYDAIQVTDNFSITGTATNITFDSIAVNSSNSSSPLFNITTSGVSNSVWLEFNNIQFQDNGSDQVIYANPNLSSGGNIILIFNNISQNGGQIVLADLPTGVSGGCVFFGNCFQPNILIGMGWTVLVETILASPTFSFTANNNIQSIAFSQPPSFGSFLTSNNGGGNNPYIPQTAHGFFTGQFITSGYNLASASATPQWVGIVFDPYNLNDPNNFAFIHCTSGMTTFISPLYCDEGNFSGNTLYYLSSITPGNVTSVPPITPLLANAIFQTDNTGTIALFL